MENNWDKDRPPLLSRLQETSESLVSPTLLERLGLREPFQTPHLRLDKEVSDRQTLLQRINDSRSLGTSRTPSNVLEGEKSLKRRLSPRSCESSEIPLTRYSPKHKRIRPLTPTSQRYNRLTRRSESPEFRTKTRNAEDRHLRTTMRLHEVSGNSPSLPTLTMNAMMKLQPNARSYQNQICPGSGNFLIPSSNLATPVARKPVGFFELSTETSPKLSSSSKSQEILPRESRLPSGREFSKETQSTSTRSSRHSTMLSLMRRERDAWETWKLLLESLNPRSEFPPPLSGLQLGERLPRSSPLLSPTEETNLSTMGSISNQNSQQNLFPPTTKSYSMTSPYAMKLQGVKTSYSLITKDLADCTPRSLCQTELNLLRTLRRTKNPPVLPFLGTNQKSATSSTLGNARIPTPSASTDTSAKNARNQVTAKKIVPTQGASEIYGLQPKYLQHNLWEKVSLMSPTTAEWSETADPLPRPPELAFPRACHHFGISH